MGNIERFKWWVILTVASTIVLLSIFELYHNNRTKISGLSMPEKWAASFAIMSLALAIPGLVCSMLPHPSTMYVEAILVWVELAIWALATALTILYDDFNLAVSRTENFAIVDANIFFWGLAGLVASVFLMSSWFRTYVLQNEEALTVTDWIFLSVAGFIVLLWGIAYRTASHTAEAPEEGQEGNLASRTVCLANEEFSCARLHFAIVLGGISATTTAILVPFRTAPLKCQQEVALLLLVAWGCGVGYLTYGTGPATNANPMYFATWASLFLSLNVVAKCGMAEQTLLDTQILPSAVAKPSLQYTLQPEFETAINRMGHPFTANSFDDPTDANVLIPVERGEIFHVAYDQFAPSPSRREAMRKEASHGLFSPVGAWRSQVHLSLRHLPIRPALSRITAPSRLNIAIDNKILAGKRTMNRLVLWTILFIDSSCCLAAYAPYVLGYSGTNSEEVDGKEDIAAKINARAAWIITSTRASIALAIAGLGLVISIVLLTRWFTASLIVKDWVLLLTTSLALHGSMRALLGDPEQADGADVALVNMAAVLGATSGGISFVMLFVSSIPIGHHLLWPNLIVSSVLLAAWCWGVSFICYGSKSPSRAHAGTIWFSSWLSLIITMDIALCNAGLLMKKRMQEREKKSKRLAFQSSESNDECSEMLQGREELAQECADKYGIENIQEEGGQEARQSRI